MAKQLETFTPPWGEPEWYETGKFLQIWVESAIYGDGLMKRSRFSEEQIIGILKEQVAGRMILIRSSI